MTGIHVWNLKIRYATMSTAPKKRLLPTIFFIFYFFYGSLTSIVHFCLVNYVTAQLCMLLSHDNKTSLCWLSRNTSAICFFFPLQERRPLFTPRPKPIEPRTPWQNDSDRFLSWRMDWHHFLNAPPPPNTLWRHCFLRLDFKHYSRPYDMAADCEKSDSRTSNNSQPLFSDLVKLLRKLEALPKL